jgi:hypothetical protein
MSIRRADPCIADMGGISDLIIRPQSCKRYVIIDKASRDAQDIPNRLCCRNVEKLASKLFTLAYRVCGKKHYRPAEYVTPLWSWALVVCDDILTLNNLYDPNTSLGREGDCVRFWIMKQLLPTIKIHLVKYLGAIFMFVGGSVCRSQKPSKTGKCCLVCHLQCHQTRTAWAYLKKRPVFALPIAYILVVTQVFLSRSISKLAVPKLTRRWKTLSCTTTATAT